jgi:hypothetical protein
MLYHIKVDALRRTRGIGPESRLPKTRKTLLLTYSRSLSLSLFFSSPLLHIPLSSNFPWTTDRHGPLNFFAVSVFDVRDFFCLVTLRVVAQPAYFSGTSAVWSID